MTLGTVTPSVRSDGDADGGEGTTGAQSNIRRQQAHRATHGTPPPRARQRTTRRERLHSPGGSEATRSSQTAARVLYTHGNMAMSVSTTRLKSLTVSLPHLSEAQLGIMLTAAAVHLKDRSIELESSHVRRAVSKELPKNVELSQVLKACCHLLRQAGKGGGASPDTLEQALAPLGFGPGHIDAITQCLLWVRAGTSTGAAASAHAAVSKKKTQQSPASSPPCSPPTCATSGIDYNPLQHAGLKGSQVAVKRRGCVSAAPANIIDAGAKETRIGYGYYASEIAGQIVLATRELAELAKEAESKTATRKPDPDRVDVALLKAEEATIIAQLFLLDAAPDVNTEKLRRQEAEMLRLFNQVSAEHEGAPRAPGEQGMTASIAALFGKLNRKQNEPVPARATLEGHFLSL